MILCGVEVNVEYFGVVGLLLQIFICSAVLYTRLEFHRDIKKYISTYNRVLMYNHTISRCVVVVVAVVVVLGGIYMTRITIQTINCGPSRSDG